MITSDIIIVFLVLGFILVSLYREIVGPALTFLIAIVILGLTNILTPSEILTGFANEQIIVIILLLLVGDIFRRTALLDIFFDSIFKTAKTFRSFLVRMTIIVAFFSAFLNNTPLVAVMMPYIHTWCKRHKIPVAKLLIPLSYAAILGGCATLIGTSTNLIVSGMVIDQTIIPDLEELSLFDFSMVGLPMIIIGILYLFFFAYRLLPSKSDAIQDFSVNARQYIVEAQVKKKSDLIGKSIKEAGLRNLEGLYLFEIIRDNYSFTAVSHDAVLQADDILLFTGDTKTIADMVGTNPSLTIPSVGMFARKKHTEVIETVVSHNSSFIGKTIKEENFRAKFDATVIAIHRNGERLSGKIGSARIKAGDAILLLAGDDFQTRAVSTSDLFVISKVKDFNRLGFVRSFTLIGGTILAILLATFGVISLFMSLTVLLIILMFQKIVSPKELSRSIDYELAIIIALSLALGIAMIKTGVAELIASFFIKICIPFGEIGLLSGIYIVTAILAAFITNKAAVAIIFPIALTMAAKQGLPPMPFVLALSFAAAANFMTPIGYQTNLMVFGPGGYSFRDFFKIGFPLTVIYMFAALTLLNWIYF